MCSQATHPLRQPQALHSVLLQPPLPPPLLGAPPGPSGMLSGGTSPVPEGGWELHQAVGSCSFLEGRVLCGQSSGQEAGAQVKQGGR